MKLAGLLTGIVLVFSQNTLAVTPNLLPSNLTQFTATNNSDQVVLNATKKSQEDNDDDPVVDPY